MSDQQHHPYYGDNKPEEEVLIFNDNLQEFALQISYVCGLEVNGSLTPEQAYKRIEKLWKGLKKVKKEVL